MPLTSKTKSSWLLQFLRSETKRQQLEERCDHYSRRNGFRHVHGNVRRCELWKVLTANATRWHEKVFLIGNNRYGVKRSKSLADCLAHRCPLSANRWAKCTTFHVAAFGISLYFYFIASRWKWTTLPVKISPVVVFKAAPTAKFE